jgi:hypothetical protein
MRDRNSRDRLDGSTGHLERVLKGLRKVRPRRAGPPKPDPRLTVRLEPLKGEPGIKIFGTANLPDGTRVRCGVWRGGPEGPFDDVMYQDTAVKAGHFAVSIYTSRHWVGVVSASVELRADGTQPEAVRAVLGDAGERLDYADLAGPGYRQVFAVTSLDIRD